MFLKADFFLLRLIILLVFTIIKEKREFAFSVFSCEIMLHCVLVSSS